MQEKKGMREKGGVGGRGIERKSPFGEHLSIRVSTFFKIQLFIL
jgi:hypothetical protein